MFGTFKTIKAKLLFSFGTILFVTLLMIVLNLWLANREERLGKLVVLLAKIDRNIQQMNNLEKDFFSDEAINPEFYRTGKSNYITKRQRILDIIYHELDTLKHFSEVRSFGAIDEIDSIAKDFESYRIVFDKLYALVRLRGFKDYGLEGKMRESIHSIENAPYPINMVLLLTARRHEKDFIMRKDEQYVSKNSAVLDELEEDIRKKIFNEKIKKELISLVNNYQKSFTMLANVEKEIGFDNNSGLKGELKSTSSKLAEEVDNLNQIIIKQVENIYASIHYISIGTIAFYIFIYFILAYFITRSLSVPISQLSQSIDRVINSNFARTEVIDTIHSKDEVGGLAEDFQYMLTKVQDSFEEIKSNSEKIAEKQHLLMKSLEYAQQIQRAILPDEEDLGNFFAEYFILYLPRDVVSGDFYWSMRRNEKLFIAVVDCTGHGVPGAFMSMIGHTLLNKIITQNKIFDPATILEVLHTEVKEALRQDARKNNDDGMDVSLCLIESERNNPKNCHLTFAGAKGKMLYTQRGELKELKGTKRSIGGSHKSESKQFENQEVTLKNSEIVYLFTDGITDQQNENDSKFGNERLKTFLNTIMHLPLQEQYGQLMLEMNTYMGKQPQRDDITVLGFRI
jgi:serine phosphatase RsbU (regulator of sigma subunit)